jgi:hypothetical protein
MVNRTTTLFREVNQSMGGLLLELQADDEADFFCECPLRDCARRVALTRTQYEEVRRSGGFLVSPECRDWRHVLERTPRYVVVADFGPFREACSEPSPSAATAEPGQPARPEQAPTGAPGSRAAA